MNKYRARDIYIRPIQASDANQTYLNWLEDPEVNQFLETRHRQQTLKMIAEFIKTKANSLDEYLMAICLTSCNLHIGNIKVEPINKYHQRADVSLFIGEKQMWGKGYAAQAIYLASKFAFEEKKLEKLKAGCYIHNIGSKKAFLKCGYVLEGELRSDIVCKGLRANSYILGLIRGDLKQPWH